MMPYRSKVIMKAVLGCSLALALILSYIESLLPLTIGIPGVKLGLANLVVIVLLYLSDWRCALAVDITRVILAGFLFGNLSAILYGLSGAIVSFLFMLVMKRLHFKMGTVSIGGGITHNIGQLLVAAFVVENGNVFFYLPWLIIVGCFTGAMIGIISSLVLPYLKRSIIL